MNANQRHLIPIPTVVAGALALLAGVVAVALALHSDATTGARSGPLVALGAMTVLLALVATRSARSGQTVVAVGATLVLEPGAAFALWGLCALAGGLYGTARGLRIRHGAKVEAAIQRAMARCAR